MGKHTPGPWRLIDDDPEDHITVTDEFQDIGVCRLERSSNNSTAEMIANGHMIAAAPEMLEALENMIDYLERKAKENPRREWTIHNAHAQSVRTAIAKARGEA